MMKTQQMLAIEAADPQGRDIRQIMTEAYAAAHSMLGAATKLGISQGAFSNWTALLGGEVRTELVFPPEEPAGEGPRPDAGQLPAAASGDGLLLTRPSEWMRHMRRARKPSHRLQRWARS